MRAAVAGRVRHSLFPQSRFWRAATPFYERYLDLRYPNGVPTFVNGEMIRVRRDCRGPGKWDPTYSTKLYEPAVARALTATLRPSDRVADIGANVGLLTVMCARRLVDGKVYAFEPDPWNAEALRAHVRMNDVADRVEVVQAAVGEAAGDVMFAAAGSPESSVGNIRESAGAPLERVPIVRLDEFVADGLDIVKIDVEGYERQVVEGATGLLADAERKPRLIVLDVHVSLLARQGTSPRALRELLEESGYAVEPLDASDAPVQLELEQWVARRRAT